MSEIQEQLLRAQLGWTVSSLEAERQLRVSAERRAAHARVLLYDLAVRLIPADLDNLRKERGEIEQPCVLPDDDLAVWLKHKLDGYLFHYRQLISGREQHLTERLQAERDRARQEVERLNATLVQVKADLQAAIERTTTLNAALSALQAEKADLLADLETSRGLNQQARAELAATRKELTTAHSVDQAISDAPAPESVTTDPSLLPSPTTSTEVQLVDYPASSDRTPAWYGEWLAATKLEERDRQSAVLQLLASGQAFFRVEAIEQLNASGLLHELDLDRPAGSTNRLFGNLIAGGFIEEIDAGYGPTVPAVLNLTARGREAYQVLCGEALAETTYEQLKHRHITPEHTVLNLLARRVLLKFGFQQVDVFPDPIPLTDGAPAEPDITAIAPDGERLYLECERGVTVRSAEKRDAKWNRTAELGRGHLYLFVPNKTARNAVYSELSEWLHYSADRWPKIELHFCEYTKALTAPTLWTYSTTVSR